MVFTTVRHMDRHTTLAVCKLLVLLLFTLLLMGGLVLPGALALDSDAHKPFLSYTAIYHDNSVQVHFQIENIEDAFVNTNIYSIWFYGDGMNQTLDGSENKSVSEVDSISHVYQYGVYDVNVTLHISRYSMYATQLDFNLTLDLKSEAGRDVKREAFVAGLQSSVVQGLWAIVPLFFVIWFVSKFIFNAPNAARWFRFGWILTTSIFLSFFVTPWVWSAIFDLLTTLRR